MGGRGERIAGTGRSMGWYREGVQLARAAHVLRRSPRPFGLYLVLISRYESSERVQEQMVEMCSLEASGTQVWDSEGSDMSNQAHRKRRSTRWVRFGSVQPARPYVLYLRFMLAPWWLGTFPSHTFIPVLP